MKHVLTTGVKKFKKPNNGTGNNLNDFYQQFLDMYFFYYQWTMFVFMCVNNQVLMM